MTLNTQFVHRLLTILLTLSLIIVNGVVTSVEAFALTASEAREQEVAVSNEVLSSQETLRWPRPTLQNPITINVPAQPTSTLITLDVARDYIIQMPSQPVRSALIIKGGRNVVMVGGEIYIPWQGTSPSIASRTGLKVKWSTGIVHIEGVLIHGEDISEGIQIDAPQATVQIQNVGVFNLHARDQVNFTDNHPDVVQPYGNMRELRIDRLTGSSDYQGLLLKSDFNGPLGPVTVSRTNIVGLPTARKLIWFDAVSGAGKVVLENVWIDVPGQNKLDGAVWPSPSGTFPAKTLLGLTTENMSYATWPVEMIPQVAGQVNEGVPPTGNFVNASEIGIGYTGASSPPPTATPVPTASATPIVTPVPTASATPTTVPSNPSAGLRISLPTTTVAAGSAVVAPLVASDELGGHNIFSAIFEIAYDPTVLELVDVAAVNTLLAGWSIQENSPTLGRIIIAAYNSSPLSGSGVLLNLHFNAIGAVGSTSALTFTKLTLNEGLPATSPQNGQVTIAELSVAGKIKYRQHNKPVKESLLSLQSSTSYQATTSYQAATSYQTASSDEGSYVVNVAQTGDYLLTPFKQGNSENALSALDAAWIAQCMVGKRSIIDCPTDTSDVSGDGNVSIFDASVIARYLVGVTESPSPIGEWRFTPPSRSYQPLSERTIAQDFTATIVGDVTASWTNLVSAETSAAQSIATLALSSAQLRTDGQYELPLSISGVTNGNISAYELTVRFDPQHIAFASVSGNESLSPNWELIYNVAEPGVLKIIGYGVEPLTGDGMLLNLSFTTVGGAYESVVTVATARFNEDAPLTNVTTGIVQTAQLNNQLRIPFIQR